MTLPAASLAKLEGVHPDLVRVILRAADGPTPFIVTEGLRTKARQFDLVATGKSRTMHSRHLTGHAVDLAVLIPGGGVSWARNEYRLLAMTVKAAAVEQAVPIRWGGEAFGPSFFDGPHFELDPKFYPAVPDLAAKGDVTA